MYFLNPDRNFLGLKGRNVSRRIINECFTQEQRAILTYTQGTVTITPEDEFESFYGDCYLTFNEEITIKRFAARVNRYAFMLDQIKEFNDKVIELTKPINYAKQRTTHSDMTSDTTTKTDSTNTGTTSSVGKVYSKDEDASENVSTAWRRSAGANTHKLNTKVEELDDKSYKTKLTFEEKDISIDFENKEVTATNRPRPNPDAPFVKVQTEDPIPYNALSFDFSKGGNAVTSLSQSMSGSTDKSDSKTTDASTGEAKSKTTGDIQYKEFKEADNVLKSFALNVPDLRIQFFNKFRDLFEDIPPHLIRHVR